jgi:hypothetical protein
MVSGLLAIAAFSPVSSGGLLGADNPAAVRRAPRSFFVNPVKAHRDPNVIRITSAQCRAAYN